MFLEAAGARRRNLVVPHSPDSHAREVGVLSLHGDTLKHADRMPCGGKSIDAPRDLPSAGYVAGTAAAQKPLQRKGAVAETHSTAIHGQPAPNSCLSAYSKNLFHAQQGCRDKLHMPLDNGSISPNPHLPPHLREVCDILARGLVRLRSRGMQAESADTADSRDIPLHFTAPQRRHANPKRKGTA